MGTSRGVGEGRRWVILGVIYLSVLAFAITLQSVPPLLSSILAELKVSYAEAGLLMSLFALPGILVSIPAGLLADRYGQKLIGVVSFILVLVGQAIFASGQSMVVLGLGRVVAGAGAMTLIVLLPQLLARWFAGRELGIAMGVFNTGMPLGTILALNVLSGVGEGLGWRPAVWLSMTVPLVALLVFVALFAAPPAGRGPAPGGEGLFRAVASAGRPIWLLAAAWLLFNAAMISLFTFTPDFLRGEGSSAASAGLVASATMWPALVLSPAVGYLMDRAGGKRTMIVAGGLVLTGLIAVVPGAVSWMLALMLLIGVAQSFVPAPIMVLAPEVVPPQKLGLAFGIISTCLNVGIIVGPAAAGWVKDVTGSFAMSYALMAVFAFLTALVMVGLRPRRSDSRH